MRIDENLKASAEKAAALKGMKSLSEYLVHLIEKDADQVIREHESVTLKDSVFDRFTAACEKAGQPNKKLKDALACTKTQGMD